QCYLREEAPEKPVRLLQYSQPSSPHVLVCDCNRGECRANGRHGSTGNGKLKGVALVKGKCKGATETRIPLKVGVWRAADEGPAAGIKVYVKRRPHAGAKVVADVKLSAADRVLGRLPALKVRICPKNPRASIEIDVPASKPLRNTNFRLDGPTVGSNIDQLGRVVLAEGRHQNDAGAYRSASPKLRELTCMH